MRTTSGSQRASDEPPRKRSRVDSDPELPAAAQDVNQQPCDSYTRDETYWYDDGSIIVIAQNVGFRIYRGVLAKHSEVFRDMFNIPQPTPEYAQQSDCPVMHISDSAAEMRSLLAVLLAGQRYLGHSALPFEDLANVIRLAHKYEMQGVLAPAIEELQRYFPADFKMWDSRLTTPHLRHAVVAVNLARLVDIPFILPTALYLCCQLDGRTLMGVQGADSPDAVIPDILAPDDVARCINGRDTLFRCRGIFLRDLFGLLQSLPDCATASAADEAGLSQCQQSRASLLHDLQTHCDSCDLLASWEPVIRRCLRTRTPQPDWPLCTACVAALCKKEKKLRYWEWWRVRGMFDLEDPADASGGGDTPVVSISSYDSDSDGA